MAAKWSWAAMSLVVVLALAPGPGGALPRIPPPAIETRVLAEGLRNPWSLAFLPGGDMLIVEKHGALRHYRQGALTPERLPGPIDVYQAEDSGLLDIALDPDFPTQPYVYVAFAEGSEASNRTAIWKARWDGRTLVDGRVIFRVRPDKRGSGHPGGRLLFLPDRSLLLTVGDGYDYAEQAQDPRSHLGKVLRLDRDGRPAAGNPFAGRSDAAPEVYSLGHRNAQGLARDPATGVIWLHEHGPMGGDELNALRPGANYGWPTVTHGLDYSGAEISEHTRRPGLEPPRVVWVPSIAPSGLAIYRGSVFPAWRGDLLVGGMKNRRLMRVRLREDGATRQEELLARFDTRIRDVRVGPDGLVYVLTDETNGRLLRIQLKPDG